jgi:hypothetical protein
MRWTALLAVTLGGCNDDPVAPEPTDPTGDAKGGCVAVVTNHWSPASNDGWTETLTYDEGGFLVDRLYDVEGPGLDFRQTWVRRPDGAYTEYAVDDDDDGGIDELETYEYDGDDLVSREYDWDGDGRIDERSDFDSEDGRILEERYDWEADGSPNSRFVFLYERDLLDRITRDDQLNGTIEWLATYTYGEGDLPRSYDADEGVDGGIEQYDRWRHDEQGRMTRWERWDVFELEDTVVRTYDHVDEDTLADSGTYASTSGGAFYQAAEWAILRDDQGRETQELWFFDYSADGEADRTLTSGTVWECP